MVAQVALTLVLLVAAGLLTRTFAKIQAIDPGFRADGVLTFRIPVGDAALRLSRGAATSWRARSRAALARCPSVTGVGAVEPPALRRDPELGRSVLGRE